MYSLTGAHGFVDQKRRRTSPSFEHKNNTIMNQSNNRFYREPKKPNTSRTSAFMKELEREQANFDRLMDALATGDDYYRTTKITIYLGGGKSKIYTLEEVGEGEQCDDILIFDEGETVIILKGDKRITYSGLPFCEEAEVDE